MTETESTPAAGWRRVVQDAARDATRQEALRRYGTTDLPFN